MSLTIDYFSFNAKRADARWINFENDFKAVKQGQELEGSVGELIEILADRSESEFDEFYLKLIDLHYGSIICEPAANSKDEGSMIEVIC